MRERLGADVQDRSDEDVGAGDQGVEAVVEGERVDALDDGLDLLLGRLASEKSSDLLTLSGEGSFCVMIVSALIDRQ